LEATQENHFVGFLKRKADEFWQVERNGYAVGGRGIA
jgi:hypothetical protein